MNESGPRPVWLLEPRAVRPRHRRSSDRARSPAPQDAPGATGPRARPSAPGAAPRVSGAPGPPGSCHRSAVCAAQNRPPPAPEAWAKMGCGNLRSRRSNVFRLTTSAHAWPRCTPALPPKAMPRATKRWASRGVRRAQGAATVGRRSVKIRRGQARLRQNHLRTRSWRHTRYAAQGRSARVRP